MLETLLAAVLPHILDLALAALVPVIALAVAQLRGFLSDYLGQRAADMIARRFGEAMQRAVVSAVADDPNANAASHAERAASYVRQTLPETVARLGASEDGLKKRALAELAALGIRKPDG